MASNVTKNGYVPSSRSNDSDSHFTTNNGSRVDAPHATLRIGGTLEGPLLLQDINLLESLSHIVHERIPERVVHAKGAGAYGVFEVTDDITDLTKADFLSEKGKKTNLFARFSPTAGESGSADSVRDSRGFAFKLYTDQGNLDWVFFSTPTFPLTDPGKFLSFTHSLKREPQTGLRSATTFWDFMSSNPETFNTIMILYSDGGTTKSYRHSDIFSINTYKFVTDDSFVYVRIHVLTDQGVETNTAEQAERLAGVDADAFIRDLHDNIADKNFPSWTVYAQVVKPDDVANFPVNIFDTTRRWPETSAPLRRFGKITLNRNVEDRFGEVEQASFTPAAIVSGWDISADPLLQSRLFAYGDAARYRLGINFHQLEVNKAKYSYNPTKRDGIGYVNSLNPRVQPNYIANDGGSKFSATNQESWTGKAQEYESPATDDFEQDREKWNEYKKSPPMDAHFISNVATNLSLAREDVRQKTYAVFEKIDKEMGDGIKKATEALVPTQATPGHASKNRGGVGGC